MKTAVQVALVSTVLWIAFLAHSGAVDGVASMPCDGGNVAWCWVRDTLGMGPAWLLLHAFVSLAVGWTLVELTRHGQTRRIAPKRWTGVERRRSAR